MPRWPNPQDYREAIQNPAICLSDGELRQGELDLDNLQLPRVHSGQYAAVFKISNRNRAWAVRCFLHNFSDRQERYRRISDFIIRDDLEYTVGFELIDQGIKIGSEWFPILKMEYVEGESLGRYVRNNVDEPEKLKVILSRLDEMMAALKHDGIAHGDLQHDNVIVTADQRLRLIDYDGMYVPRLAGWHSNELGHRNYQHPGRTENLFGPNLDNFSAWVIKGALQCLIEDSSIWQHFRQQDESFLLTREDYISPDYSKNLFELESKHGVCQMFSRRIRTLVKQPVDQVPYLGTNLIINSSLPKLESPKVPAKVLESVDVETPDYAKLAELIDKKSKVSGRGIPQALQTAIGKGYRLLVLDDFPSLLLLTDAFEPNSTKSVPFSLNKSEVMRRLEEKLLVGESIVWSGGLSPMKMSTGQQNFGGPLKVSTFVAGALLLFFTACGIAMHAQLLAAPFLMLSIAFAAIAIIVAVSDSSGPKGLTQLIYALTDRNLTICTGTAPQLRGNQYERKVYSTSIPIKTIKQATFFAESKGEKLAERVELLIEPASKQTSDLRKFWLHGLTSKDKLALMTRLRSLGIQCREVT